MGAWDFGPFDNDDASDWLAELADSKGISAFKEAFGRVADSGGEYLEAPEASVAIAAAEIVAALRGKPAVALPEPAGEWLTEHRGLSTDELVPLAVAAVERVRADSELKELWAESEQSGQWESTLDSVLTRLRA